MNSLCKIVQLGLCLLIALIGVTSLTRADQTVLVVHTADFPPYVIENPGSDGLLGFDAEVAVEAFKRMGQPARVEYLPWKRVLWMAEHGKTAAVLSCAKAKERDLYFHYSDPISTSTKVYAASKTYSGKVPLTLEEGKDLNVVTVSGYSSTDDLDKANVAYHAAETDETALNILLKRNYDFFYSYREYLQFKAVGLNVADQLQYFEIPGQILFHLCFSQEWPNSVSLMNMFNKGLSEIRADGTYDAIHDKYR